MTKPKPQVPPLVEISPPIRDGAPLLVHHGPQIDRNLIAAFKHCAAYRGGLFALHYGAIVVAGLALALALDLNTAPPWQYVGRTAALAYVIACLAFAGVMQRRWRDQTLATLNGFERRLDLPETKGHRERGETS